MENTIQLSQLIASYNSQRIIPFPSVFENVSYLFQNASNVIQISQLYSRTYQC